MQSDEVVLKWISAFVRRNVTPEIKKKMEDRKKQAGWDLDLQEFYEFMEVYREVFEANEAYSAVVYPISFIKNEEVRQKNFSVYRQQQRCKKLKEEIIQAAFHPKRVSFWLENGGHKTLEMMFGY